MPFEKRFSEIIKKITVPAEKHLYIDTAIFGLVIHFSVLDYNILRRGFHGISTINSAAAWTAVILISLSMALSSICYFFDFADTKIIYRKSLGLVGFGWALVHIILSAFFNPEIASIWEFFSPEKRVAFLAGLSALTIFTIMAAISNQFAVHEMGGKNWRRLLRLGYVALIFVLIHVYILSSSFWNRWLLSGRLSLPPIGIVLTIFILTIFLSRIILEIVLIRKRKTADQT